MRKKKKEINIYRPINQLQLFNYNKYFVLLADLYKKNLLNKCNIFSGPKGIGKATFLYHFINYILSFNEDDNYSISDYSISSNNYTYKRIIDNSHPNLHIIDNEDGSEKIRVDQIRNLLKFINKTTYSQELKIIMIDNFEKFNLNSSNALLKAIEEPPNDTYFFIIHDNSYKILETIKSRSIEFKIHFNKENKIEMFEKICNHYNEEFTNIDDDLYYDTPGNLFRKCLYLNQSEKPVEKNTLSYANFFLDTYQNEKDLLFLQYASYYIEKFFCENAKKNSSKVNSYFFNYFKIANQIDSIKKFNLFDKNTIPSIKHILKYASG